jgi:hypothetical protein
VSDPYTTALGGTVTVMAVSAVVVARNWGTTRPAKHRAPHKLNDDDLIGPPTAYTQVDPDAETYAFGVVQTGIGWCEACFETKAGVITRNGFRCDDFQQHPEAGAA